MSYGSYGDGGFYFLQPVDQYGGLQYGWTPKASSRLSPTGLKTTSWVSVTTSDGTKISQRQDGALRVDFAKVTSFWHDYVGDLFADPVSPLYGNLLAEYQNASTSLDTPDPIEVIETVPEESLFDRFRLPLMIAGGLGAAYFGYRYFRG